MITVIEPLQHIAVLWSKPEVRDGTTFRLMRYVLRVDHEGKVLLHNVVTGQLVVLDQDEAITLEGLPTQYSPIMEQLVNHHFVVPLEYDEHRKVVAIRNLLIKLCERRQKSSGIVFYTILPTTACNAHCWYCFEKGMKQSTMTEQTASEVVKFIQKQCNGQAVMLKWLGGEPTVAANRIDQICKGLQNYNVQYSSEITTNGYLFDDAMIERSSQLWHLKRVRISLDGSEKNYNEVKAFSNVKDNPYQRVLQNVGTFLNHQIEVYLRMNFDQNNYQDFAVLLSDVQTRFKGNSLLQVFAHQINDFEHDNPEQFCQKEKWIAEKYSELNNLSQSMNLLHRKHELPSLNYTPCVAHRDDCVTITPEGNLVRCAEQYQSDQTTGNIQDGVCNQAIVQSWKRISDYERCSICELFPDCLFIMNCAGGDRCFWKSDKLNCYRKAIQETYYLKQ